MCATASSSGPRASVSFSVWSTRAYVSGPPCFEGGSADSAQGFLESLG